MTNEEKIKLYPKTEFFEVTDTIGVPHPFCITHHHVAWASDKFMGMLGNNAIESYEKHTKRPSCGVNGCNLKFEEHEACLTVYCKTKDNEALQVFLKSIVEQCEKDGFVGFVLIDGTNETK